jgi:hypothetical protein
MPKPVRILTEGGGHKCLKDDFYTEDEIEWEEHCTAYDPATGTTHNTESGVAPCIICHTEVECDNIPFPIFDEEGRKIVKVLCEECEPKMGHGISKGKRLRDMKAMAATADTGSSSNGGSI